jgi:hypothetical protein
MVKCNYCKEKKHYKEFDKPEKVNNLFNWICVSCFKINKLKKETEENILNKQKEIKEDFTKNEIQIIQKLSFEEDKWLKLFFQTQRIINESEYIQDKSKTYIMKDCSNGYYKIGKSYNPIFREKTLQAEKPTIKIIKVFDSNIEKKLHTDYSKYRLRGEWFNLTKIQIRYICTHYK